MHAAWAESVILLIAVISLPILVRNTYYAVVVGVLLGEVVILSKIGVADEEVGFGQSSLKRKLELLLPS